MLRFARLAIDGFASGAGIVISGPAASGNAIESSVIGTNPTGIQARPNFYGVQIMGGAHDNSVGSTDSGAGNVIADNIESGVVVQGDGSVGNRISGNRIFGNGEDGPAGLRFDGSANHVELPSFAIGGAMTVEAWVESDNVHASWARVIDFGNGAGDENIVLAWDADSGQMTWDVFDVYGNAFGVTTTAVFPQGRWVHVAATVDAQGNGAIYWDGQLVASGAMIAPPAATRTHQYLGLSNWWFQDSPFTGSLDDVKIWSEARTADQVRNDMTGTLTGNEAGLEAYYQFDEGQGSTAHDSSANDRDGTLAILTDKNLGIFSFSGDLPSWNDGSNQAIDLNGDGVTANSPYPQDGPNRLESYPVFFTDADGHSVGWLKGVQPGALYHVEFFASARYGSNGSGEAEDFLGSLDVTADSIGEAFFDVPDTLPAERADSDRHGY